MDLFLAIVVVMGHENKFRKLVVAKKRRNINMLKKIIISLKEKCKENATMCL